MPHHTVKNIEKWRNQLAVNVVLYSKYDFLVEELNPDAEFLRYFIDDFNPFEMDYICAGSTRRERATRFIEIMALEMTMDIFVTFLVVIGSMRKEIFQAFIDESGHDVR